LQKQVSLGSLLLYELEIGNCQPWTLAKIYFETSRKYHQDRNIEHLIILGMRYVRMILEATGNERRDLMLHSTDNFCGGLSARDFISDALGPLGLEIPLGEHAAVNVPEELSLLISYDDSFLVPPWWVWLGSNGKYLNITDRSDKSLHDWIYVSWDYTDFKIPVSWTKSRSACRNSSGRTVYLYPVLGRPNDSASMNMAPMTG